MIRKIYGCYESILDEENRLPLPDEFVTPGETFYIRADYETIDPEITLQREKYHAKLESLSSQYPGLKDLLSQYEQIIIDEQCQLPLSDKMAEYLGNGEWITVLNNGEVLKLFNMRTPEDFSQLKL